MLEFPYRPIYWQALIFTYSIGLHQVRRCVFVYVGKLVGRITSTFFIQHLQTFLFLSRFLHFLTFCIFFLESFLHLCRRRTSPVGWKCLQGEDNAGGSCRARQPDTRAAASFVAESRQQHQQPAGGVLSVRITTTVSAAAASVTGQPRPACRRRRRLQAVVLFLVTPEQPAVRWQPLTQQEH